jgi:hypothetical protein
MRPFTTKAAAQPVVGVGLYLDDFALAHMDEHAAIDGAETASRFFYDFVVQLLPLIFPP